MRMTMEEDHHQTAPAIDLDSMEDDDDDTVVGTCLHCNAPPPPRGGGGSSTYSGGGGGPCSGSNSVMASSAATSPSAATRVQVSCDDCRSFICDGCHWCHEFQANHEIRVCDRCDAFYCRGCDEMDQCEDCSEVVCNTCSTLMSCKFCGCGLCEDCATACGRCGIVLCARDAKFAVECDTCRMSYCLVCLASGTKDPCVRCGHRPSKRVEQLVHLRLKSIYKAFKQSGASMGPGSGNGGGSGSNSGSGGGCKSSDGSGRDTSTMGGKYSSALRSLTDNGTESSKDTFTNFDQSMASEVAAVLQTASNSMANSDGGDYDGHSRRSRGKRVSSHDHSPAPGGTRHRSSSRASNAAAERYFRKTQAEMEAAAAAAEAEADAAAAALLAELDDEEKATSTSKKSKKKKKKKEKKKEAAAVSAVAVDSPKKTDTVKSADKGDNKNFTPQRKKGSRKNPPKNAKDSPPIEDDSSDEEMNFEQLVAGAKNSARPSKKEKKEDSEEKAVTPPPKPKPEPPPPVEEAPAPAPSTADDFDAELAILLSNEDEEGLETFLGNLKGVPGLGAARKTAKKALKKIREARQPTISVEPEKPQSQSNNASNVEPDSKSTKPVAKTAAPKQIPRTTSATSTPTIPAPPPSTGNQHEPLLRVVSRTQSNVGTTSSRGGTSSTASVPASARAECVMHMSPAVVGWVIGKGGSRIRDMMEESGAKIWIDQESMGAKEARVVYVSGKRSSVDSAVRMVKDLVAKAPVAASATTSQGSIQAPAPVSSGTVKSAPVPTASTTAQNTSTVEAPKQEPPASFAAAIASGASTPAAVTPPGPNPATPTKQPAPTQSWALPASGVNAPVAPQPQAVPHAVPQKMKVLPTQPPVTNTFDAGAAKLFPQTMTAELRCDPRFVVLLIGRRGWTVKNIQAESGADLHIDQNVDPPKIIISGEGENVKKAEQMVRDVLKYPQAQLHQEVPQKPNNDTRGSVENLGMGATSRPEQYNVGDLQMMPNKPANLSMPLPTNLQRDVSANMPAQTSLHRDISSTTPKLLEELHMQQQPAHQSQNLNENLHAEGAMNLPPGYQYQQQNPQNLGLFQDPSSANRISDFFPNDDQHQTLPPSVNVNPNAQIQHQEWGHHSQPSVQNRYSALPPFSSAEVSSRDQYMHTIPNASLAHQSPPQARRPSGFALPPEQRLHFPQNLETTPQASIPPPQLPSSRMNDFVSAGGSSSHNGNGWEMPANGANVAGTWNQSQHMPSMPRNHQQPSFQPQTAQPLSDNPFQHQTQTHNDITATSQPTNDIRVSDDSLMVDNMFASLGNSDSDGGGLLNALNSVSLGGEGGASQQANWGSQIAGWGAGETDSNRLFNK